MKKFTAAETRDLFGQVVMGEISLSRMVEILNEMVSEAGEPVLKFKKGDKVRIKNGVSSKTHRNIIPTFLEEMDELIGKTITVSGYTHENGYVVREESGYRFHEEWLEPYTDELKEGDLAIFWDNHPKDAFIHLFDRYLSPSDSLPYIDKVQMRWKNAIKFESKEQFEKVLRGEI